MGGERIMNREVARKRPANLPYRVLPPKVSALPTETWVDSKYVLLGRVRTAERRGEVASVSDWSPVPNWPGHYAVKVVRLKPARSTLRRRLPALIGVGAVGGALGAVVYMMIPVLLTGLTFLIGGAAAFGLVVALLRGGGINVTQIVNVRR
jgi:hypothetical protein